jgi:hypothetical protein
MRPQWLEPGVAIGAALLVAACAGSHASSPPASDAGPDAACGAVAEPDGWAGWAMPNPAGSGLSNPTSYAVNAAGDQVTDNVTGLIWQRNVAAGSFAWSAAIQYCACLTLDGSAGFRLPSRIELASIADWTRATPAIDASAFPGTPSESFWSASPLLGEPGLSYLVDFDSSHTSYSDMGYAYRARCVRGQTAATTPASGRYTVASGTVLDTQTKLTWQQLSPPDQYTWSDALAYCAALPLAGAGWRVPAIGELQTIVDDSVNPSIDDATFPKTPSEYFWSSSLVITDPARAWTGYFANGSTYPFVITMARNVRCVR